MRVLICTGIFPPEPGGPATYSKLLAEEFLKRGHEVRVITYIPSQSPLKVRGEEKGGYEVVGINRSRFKPWNYFKYYRAVLKYGKDADVLYVQDPVSAGYPTMLAARTLKKQFVLKITGDYSWEQAMNRKLTDKLIDEFQRLNSYPWPINKIRDIQIRVCKAAKFVITPSEYLKRMVIGWGVKESRLKVIYNSVRELSECDRENVRRELNLTLDDFLILSVGREVPWKGFAVLEQVVSDLQKTNRNLKLKILHTADRKTLETHLCAADLFILNTGYEGFSHTILEAMTAGLPVITTNVGGNLEVVKSGENGIIVEYNNQEQLKEAILKLYNDSSLRSKLIENGKQTLARFSFQNMINQTEDLLKTCVS